MGTRADFYVGRGKDAEWIGSIGWDGYPNGNAEPILKIKDENEYRAAVSKILKEEKGTTPDKGWPWPWVNSHTTDYSYAFDGGMVHASNWGYSWWPAEDWEKRDDVDEEDSSKSCVFPDFSTDRFARPNDPRSGIIAI